MFSKDHHQMSVFSTTDYHSLEPGERVAEPIDRESFASGTDSLHAEEPPEKDKKDKAGPAQR